ncbi:MAG TPA: ABC transporter permease [Terracidiphilus sp.]|jgi:predicted permease
MGEIFRRIRYLINRRRFDAELESDMEFHREMAARAGRSNFGNTLRMREQAREAWGWTWLDRLVQDLSYAARTLARSPGFTLTAVLVLAIGIGVNVAAFSLFNMVALEPLPVRDPGSLVRLERRSPQNYASEMPYLSAVFYGEHAKSLQAMIAVLGIPPMQVDDDDLQTTSASFATANYFSELGTRAAVGRLFDPARESEATASPVVVLSYTLWQHRFNGDPGVVGRTVRLNRKPAMVIGVTPYEFASLGEQTPDVWMPMVQQPYFVSGSTVLNDPGASSVRMWGRLAPGVTAKAAAEELKALTNQLRRQNPKDIWDDEYIDIHPGGHLQVMQPEMYQVAAMVGLLTMLILAVTCANLGGLLLARAVTREREIGIRMAIGATRARIFRQLSTESVALALLGATAGLGLSSLGVRVALTEFHAQGWLSARPDWRVLFFTFGIALAAAVFFGFAPALQIARQRQRKTMVRQVLIGAQVAASCMLLIVAGLLVRATLHVLYTDPGFAYEQLLSVDAHLAQHNYAPAEAQAYLDAMQERIRTLPGVKSVSLVKLPPMGHTVSRMDEEINGHPVPIYPNWVTPGLFETMGIPVHLGRTFYAGEKNAVIVSESMARREWPGQNPIGQQLPNGDAKDTVVGVVGDAHVNAVNDDDAVEQYWPARQADMPDMVVMVRTAGEQGHLPTMIKGISESMNAKLFPEIRQMKVLYHDNVLELIENIAKSVTLIGLVAVLVAAVGIIGLVSFSVSQRIKEIAIRMALGAGKMQLLSAVLGQFLWPVAIGMAAGAGIAAAASRLLRIVLFGVSNLDPASYAGAILVLVTIVGLAALLPARRALRLDLAKTLHYD